MTMRRVVVVGWLGAVVAAAVGLWQGRGGMPAPAGAQAGRAPILGGVPPMPAQVVRSQVPEVRVSVVARNLAVPWAIAFASDGRMFFTERPGRIRVIRG